MLTGTLLALWLTGSPEPVDVELPGVPPPTLAEPEPEPEPVEPPPKPRRMLRCLPNTEPCYRSTSARLLLGTAGALATGTALGLIFGVGDRQRIGDPAVAIASSGVVALGGAVLGGVVALLRGDGASIPDRITPPTFGLGLTLGGSSVTDEREPYSMSGSFAPTWTFPRERGRLRLLGLVGGQLGELVERDPRPQHQVADNGSGGTFGVALRSSTLRVEGGLDLAVRLPYPVRSRSPGLGQFELRYKPLVFFARENLQLSDGQSARVSQRIALTPLNLGLRWHVSPRQRFTFYLGPRWDFIGYGEPGAVINGKPALAPIYGESWFDIDVPLQKSGRSRRATAVGQFTVGYIHSRFGVEGINVGATVGFLGHMVTQFAVRVRPRDAAIAYQIEVGARVGQAIAPYLRVGLVLPDVGGKR